MKESDYDEPTYEEKQSNPWIHFSEQWIQRQANEFGLEMTRQKLMKPLPSKLEFEKELRHQLTSQDISSMSEDEHQIFRAEARERARRKLLGSRVDAAYKLGKSGGYQPPTSVQ